VIYPSSYGFVVEGLLARSIDLAFMGPASFASAKNSDHDVQAFASYSKKANAFQEEGAYYRSLLVVRSNSRFRDNDSLKGAKLALVDPASTSGAVLPRYMYSPVIKAPFEKYFGQVVFTGSHDKSIAAVASGQVDAAFVSTGHLSGLIDAGKESKDNYRVLWQSEPIPLDPFVYRDRLCAPIKEKIIDGFLKATPEQSKLLLDGFNASKLVPASDADYRMIHELY